MRVLIHSTTDIVPAGHNPSKVQGTKNSAWWLKKAEHCFFWALNTPAAAQPNAPNDLYCEVISDYKKHIAE